MSLSKEDLIVHWRQNPVEASNDIMGVDLAPFQRIILNTLWTVPFTILIQGRGTGKTFMLSLFSALRAILYPGEQIAFVAPSFRQSAHIFTEVEKLYERSRIFRLSCIDKSKRTPSEYYIPVKRNGRIVALPIGDGSKIRGQRAHTLAVDEAAQTPSDIIDQVLMPMGATHKDPMGRVRDIQRRRRLGKQINSDTDINRFIMSSSAYFQFNHLYKRVKAYENIYGYYLSNKAGIELPIMDDKDIWNAVDQKKITDIEGMDLVRFMSDLTKESVRDLNPEKGKLYRVVKFTYEDPPEGFMDDNVTSIARKTMTETEFMMEYMCVFPADSDGFFKRSLIDSADSNMVHIEVEGVIGRQYILGIDPARTGDRFAIFVLGVENNESCYLANVITLHRKEFDIMHETIRNCIDRYKNVIGIYMDRDGGGLPLRDMLAKGFNGQPAILDPDDPDYQFTHGVKILHMIKFHTEFLKDANFTLKSSLEQQRLLLPHPGGLIYTADSHRNDDIDRGYGEIEELKKELQNIVVTVTGQGFMHFDTPSKRQHKDRYSAMLLAHWGFMNGIFRKSLQEVEPAPQELPTLPDAGWAEQFGGGDVNDLALVEENYIGVPK